jgi:ABC-type transport system involved in multi-copper enzyme maturation permease subunit
VRPILSIASTTIGEAIRRRVLLIILLIGVLFLAIAPSLGILSARSETTVLKGMMLGVIQLTSAVIAVVLTVYMLPNEIERRTIYTILSKPVQRWQFLVGKYLGAVGALAIMMVLMSVVMVLMYWYEQRSPISDIANLMKAPLMYFVQMSLLAAVAVMFSTFVSPLVNFFLSGGLYLLGSLFNPFFETISQNANTPSATKAIAKIIDVVLPNFANYNVQNPIINPQQQIGNEGQYFISATLYGVVYILGLLVIGILVFDRREV